MRRNIVLTLTGTDRVGIVEEVTGVLLGLGSNIEEGRMARLGGEFAMLMLVSIPADRLMELDAALDHLVAQGFRVATTPTEPSGEALLPGWLPYVIEVRGADHEGIVHDIARALSVAGINVESMDTSTTEAPVSGAPLFEMRAKVLVPPGLPEEEWVALAEAAHHANVDIEITPEL